MRSGGSCPRAKSGPRRTKPNMLKTVELFAGIGGFRVAADRSGLKTVWANDICPRAKKVYVDRFGAEEFREGDISDLIDHIPHHDILTGGFPCQPFSSAGKKRGIEDPRGTLFSKIVDVLERHQPRFFILENVKRLLSMDQGKHFATILASLSKLDYLIEWRLLNAVDFGLAQNRQRVFIVGKQLKQAHRKNDINGETDIRLASIDEFSATKPNQRENIRHPTSWTRIGSHTSKFPSWGFGAFRKICCCFVAKVFVQVSSNFFEECVAEGCWRSI